MTPYYEEDGITIYHGDCREILPSIAVVPHRVLTDPPYGISYSANRGASTPSIASGTVIGDDVPFDPTWLLEYGRCVIFGANYFAHLLPPGGWIVWSKVQDNRWATGPSSRRSLAEVAWTNCHQHVALFNCFWAGSPLYRLGEDRGSQLHPTQKPLSLMRWIVERTTKLEQLILDPYMGSGPVARAAADCGRRYVGIEIDERYCEIAAKRLAQGVLFGEAS